MESISYKSSGYVELNVICYPCFFCSLLEMQKGGVLFLGHVDLVHAYDLLVTISIVMYSEDI